MNNVIDPPLPYAPSENLAFLRGRRLSWSDSTEGVRGGGLVPPLASSTLRFAEDRVRASPRPRRMDGSSSLSAAARTDTRE